jgi:hypothetical protein
MGRRSRSRWRQEAGARARGPGSKRRADGSILLLAKGQTVASFAVASSKLNVYTCEP